MTADALLGRPCCSCRSEHMWRCCVWTWRQCGLCSVPLRSDLAGGEVVSQLHLPAISGGGKGVSVILPGWSPSCLSRVPAGVATFICIFYCIYLFAWLISSGSHSRARCVLSLSLHERQSVRERERETSNFSFVFSINCLRLRPLRQGIQIWFGKYISALLNAL